MKASHLKKVKLVLIYTNLVGNAVTAKYSICHPLNFVVFVLDLMLINVSYKMLSFKSARKSHYWKVIRQNFSCQGKNIRRRRSKLKTLLKVLEALGSFSGWSGQLACLQWHAQRCDVALELCCTRGHTAAKIGPATRCRLRVIQGV